MAYEPERFTFDGVKASVLTAVGKFRSKLEVLNLDALALQRVYDRKTNEYSVDTDNGYMYLLCENIRRKRLSKSFFMYRVLALLAQKGATLYRESEDAHEAPASESQKLEADIRTLKSEIASLGSRAEELATLPVPSAAELDAIETRRKHNEAAEEDKKRFNVACAWRFMHGSDPSSQTLDVNEVHVLLLTPRMRERLIFLEKLLVPEERERALTDDYWKQPTIEFEERIATRGWGVRMSYLYDVLERIGMCDADRGTLTLGMPVEIPSVSKTPVRASDTWQVVGKGKMLTPGRGDDAHDVLTSPFCPCQHAHATVDVDDDDDEDGGVGAGADAGTDADADGDTDGDASGSLAGTRKHCAKCSTYSVWIRHAKKELKEMCGLDLKADPHLTQRCNVRYTSYFIEEETLRAMLQILARRHGPGKNTFAGMLAVPDPDPDPAVPDPDPAVPDPDPACPAHLGDWPTFSKVLSLRARKQREVTRKQGQLAGMMS